MPRSYLQSLKVKNLTKGRMTATGADFTITEADLADATSAKFILACGTLGAAGITVLSIHASDTAGFTPAAGNLVSAMLTTDLPVDADDGLIKLFEIADPARHGRYWSAIVTAGANACDAALLCVYEPKTTPTSAATAGADTRNVVN